MHEHICGKQGWVFDFQAKRVLCQECGGSRMTRHDQGTEASPDPWQGVNRFHVEYDPDQPGIVYHVEAGPNQPAGCYMWADRVDRARAAVEAAHQQEIARLARSRTEAIASAQRVYEQYSVVCERLDKVEAERDALAAQIAGLRETLQGIADADPRTWDEGLNTDAEFRRWAQSRARAALAATEQGGTDGD